MIDPNGFLMIEPRERPRGLLLDSMARKVTALLRGAQADRFFMGYHECICGARSDSYDWHVTIAARKRRTNSLAIHYVACHRNEIAPEQLREIEAFTRELEPTAQEHNALIVVEKSPYH